MVISLVVVRSLVVSGVVVIVLWEETVVGVVSLFVSVLVVLGC